MARAVPGQLRPKLDPPGLINQNEDEQYEAAGTNAPGAERTIQLPLAPNGETRVMLANRVTSVIPNDAFQSMNYAEQDSQKGGAPGSSGGAAGGTDPESATNFITSESPTGVTTPGGIPSSALKLSYGLADYSQSYPTFEAAHAKISQAPNPNAVQFNPGQWTSEGPVANTQYTSPAPWAQGAFIG